MTIELLLGILAVLVAAVLFFSAKNARKVASVEAIFVYPVKSCRWIQVDAWPVTDKGLEFDRQFLIVNAQTHRFVTQRQNPKLVLIQPAIDAKNRLMSLSFPGMKEKLVVPLDEPRAGELYTVHVWGDSCDGVDLGEEAATWLNRALDMNVRLVRFADDGRRPTAKGSGEMRFPDQYPMLLCSKQAVQEIQQAIPGDAEVLAQQFRPNIVLGDCDAHAEDAWCGSDIEINKLPISMIQHCARCRVPNINTHTGEIGEVSDDKVTQAMKQYRKGTDVGLASDPKAAGQVFFGQHAIPRNRGVISVGDAVKLRGTQLVGLDDMSNSTHRK